MLKEVHVRSSAERDDGSPMFLGVWIETWVSMRGTGVWMLVAYLSAGAPSRGCCARGCGCGRMMNQRRSPPLELLPPLFRRKLLDHEDAEAGFR